MRFTLSIYSKSFQISLLFLSMLFSLARNLTKTITHNLSRVKPSDIILKIYRRFFIAKLYQNYVLIAIMSYHIQNCHL